MVTTKFRVLFFDSRPVRRAVDAARRKVLSKAGAFIRRRAKSSIRKRKRPSSPGSPPSSHTGILKKFIFFGYDPTSESVVVGPARTNQVFFSQSGQPVTGTVPSVLEYGGSIRVLEVDRGGRWRRADLRSRRRIAGRRTRLRKVRIDPRPYMQPALEKEKANFPELWRNAVKSKAA